MTDPRPTSSHPIAESPSFGPTTGLFTGIVGLLIVGLVVVLTLAQDRTLVGLRVILGALAVGVVVWCYLLRPRIVLKPTSVLLRNAVVDHDIAYTAIDDVVVRTITRVYVGAKAYPGLGVGHPARRLMRNQTRDSTPLAATTAINGKLLADALPDFVQDQILQRVTLARGGEPATGAARTRLAVPETVLMAFLVVGLVVSLLI